MSKKITMSVKWVAWMLWGMGALFICMGAGVCLLVNLEGAMTPEDRGLFTALFLGLFGSFGVIMAVVGTIIWSRISRREKLRERLWREGNYALATIMDVSVNYGVQVNNRSPFVLRCQYKHSDGNTYIFKSGYLRFNPQSLMPDGKVKVWFDRNNIKDYYVDIEESIEGGYIEL